jgi:Domain of unknown function (DUF4185)
MVTTIHFYKTPSAACGTGRLTNVAAAWRPAKAAAYGCAGGHSFFRGGLWKAKATRLLSTLFGVCALSVAAQDFPPLSSLQPAHKDKAFSECFRQTNGWVAGDGAISVPLSDGRVLWLFGDSYVDQFDPKTWTLPCLFDARNAVLLQNTNDLMHPQTLRNAKKANRSFFQPPDAKAGEPWPCFWPGAGFQEGNTIYIYLTEMQETPQGGMWGFKAIGHYWAKMSFPELKVTGYVKLPSFNGISFSCGFVRDEPSGLTYAFGNKQHGIGGDVYVARFPTKHPADNWSFWDGKGWTANATNAAVAAQGASTSVNICQVRNKFLLLTTAFSVACDQGREIYLSVADQPTGPFSPRKRIFTVDDTVQGHYPFFYLATAHPEFVNADGLLITYCINGYEPCVPTCVAGRMNPDYYRPRAIRLALK